MKHQRMDYARLADALADRGLADREALQLVLAQSNSGDGNFAEILVSENLVSDREIGRVASEVFGLPYLPVDVYPPSPKAVEGLDENYLLRYGLVPLDRFGGLLTVAMPGIVPPDVLASLLPEDDVKILPVIGNVSSNRHWLQTNLTSAEPAAPQPAVQVSQQAPQQREPLQLELAEPSLPTAAPSAAPATIAHSPLNEVEAALESIDATLPIDESWASIFDAGDEAVHLNVPDDDPV